MLPFNHKRFRIITYESNLGGRKNRISALYLSNICPCQDILRFFLWLDASQERKLVLPSETCSFYLRISRSLDLWKVLFKVQNFKPLRDHWWGQRRHWEFSQHHTEPGSQPDLQPTFQIHETAFPSSASTHHILLLIIHSWYSVHFRALSGFSVLDLLVSIVSNFFGYAIKNTSPVASYYSFQLLWTNQWFLACFLHS